MGPALRVVCACLLPDDPGESMDGETATEQVYFKNIIYARLIIRWESLCTANSMQNTNHCVPLHYITSTCLLRRSICTSIDLFRGGCSPPQLWCAPGPVPFRNASPGTQVGPHLASINSRTTDYIIDKPFALPADCGTGHFPSPKPAKRRRPPSPSPSRPLN